MQNLSQDSEEAGRKESVDKAMGGTAYIWRAGATSQQKDNSAPTYPTVASRLSQIAEGLRGLFPHGPFTIISSIIIKVFLSNPYFFLFFLGLRHFLQ
jgi:hypothetical protein